LSCASMSSIRQHTSAYASTRQHHLLIFLGLELLEFRLHE
jgi:hypothetical protein